MRAAGWFFASGRASLLTVALILGSTACARGPSPRTAAAAGAAAPVTPVEVTDQDFAAHAYRLLLDGEPTGERSGVLVGVVRRQLARAAQRFSLGSQDIGLRAVIGAFLLARAGEYRPELTKGGARALSDAAAEVARLGHEGYSVALYTMLARELSEGPERAEALAHLKAIDDFGRATQGGGEVQAAGSAARIAVQRALLEASPEALNEARQFLTRWVRRAQEGNFSERAMLPNMERERFDAYRAMRGGTIGLVALYLRHGDPAGALAAIEEGDLERLLPPEIRELLERAGDERSSEAWSELFRLFESASQGGASEVVFDPELMAAASWGSSLELFRSEPGSLQAAMPLAAQLVRYGMAEAASLVLAGAVGRSSPPEHVGAALGMVLNAIVAEDAGGQVDAARRTFAAAEQLLALADGRGVAGRVAPSAARVRYVMAAIETRHAELERAMPFLQRAVATEPTPDAFTMIASIERQRKNHDAALAALDKVIDLARRGGDPITETEALVQRFETLRDAGRAEPAASALNAALARSVETQRLGRPGPSQARVERLLARVLEHYGEPAAIRRATERAFEAANGDVRQLAATVLDASRRALTLGDLQAARTAAQRAIEASLGSDEIVYVALWLQLLERKFNVPSDGTVEEAYATIDEASGWPSKLRAWARGKLSDTELVGAARDAAQRTEASFYTAMSGHVRGQAAALGALRDVASSAAIDLMEVTIARDLVSGPRKYALPAAVAIP